LVRNEAPRFELLTLAAFLVPLIVLGIYPAPILVLISSTVKSLTGLGLV
jgi:NADH:ubiquinone oxidoreductase subunit 4 (subunit M)